MVYLLDIYFFNIHIICFYVKTLISDIILINPEAIILISTFMGLHKKYTIC